VKANISENPRPGDTLPYSIFRLACYLGAAVGMDNLLSLSNPLATVEQLSNSSSQLDGVPSDLESSVRFAGTQLTQAAGILLRLPQEVIAQATVIFARFYVGPEGGSFLINAAQVLISPVQNFHSSLTQSNRMCLQHRYT